MHPFLTDDFFDTAVCDIYPDKTVRRGFIECPEEFWNSKGIVYEMYTGSKWDLPEDSVLNDIVRDDIVRVGMTTDMRGRFGQYRAGYQFVKNGGTYDQQLRAEMVDGQSIIASQSIKFFKPKATSGWSEIGKYLVGPKDLAQAAEAYRISYWKQRGKKLHNPQTPNLKNFQHLIDIAA